MRGKSGQASSPSEYLPVVTEAHSGPYRLIYVPQGVANLPMNEDIRLPFDLPAVARKNVSAAFDGGRITSDGGVMLLAQAGRPLVSPTNSPG